MRWFLRRLVFYAFAVWVALTLNFLLPRLMPGDPIGGVLQHLSPAQIQSNPGIIQTYQALLGGGKSSIWHDYGVYLHRLAHLNFGISTSNYPAPVSDVIGRTLPYSIFLVGVAFIIAFALGTAVGMIAAWRRGGGFDTVVVPTLMALSAFPAFFTALLGVYFLGLKLHWFPIQHAYDSGIIPGFNWTFVSSAFRHAQLPILVIITRDAIDVRRSPAAVVMYVVIGVPFEPTFSVFGSRLIVALLADEHGSASGILALAFSQNRAPGALAVAEDAPRRGACFGSGARVRAGIFLYCG